MSPNEARRILKTLADGIDPETGEILPTTSVFNSPQTIRALYVAIRSLDSSVERAARRLNRDSPANNAKAGQPWSDSEDKNLLAEFDADNSSIIAIAAIHGRTQGAIAARLVRLGRIQDRSEVYVRPFEQHEHIVETVT